MKLYTEEWVQALIKIIQTDEVFQKKGKKFKAVYQYVIKAVPEKGVENDFCYAIKYPEAEVYWMGMHEKPDYTMTASYQVMHDILTGKTNAVVALTKRQAFVSGNLANLLRFNGAINRLVEIMQGVKAEADGEFDDNI